MSSFGGLSLSLRQRANVSAVSGKADSRAEGGLMQREVWASKGVRGRPVCRALSAAMIGPDRDSSNGLNVNWSIRACHPVISHLLRDRGRC